MIWWMISRLVILNIQNTHLVPVWGGLVGGCFGDSFCPNCSLLQSGLVSQEGVKLCTCAGLLGEWYEPSLNWMWYSYKHICFSLWEGIAKHQKQLAQTGTRMCNLVRVVTFMYILRQTKLAQIGTRMWHFENQLWIRRCKQSFSSHWFGYTVCMCVPPYLFYPYSLVQTVHLCFL